MLADLETKLRTSEREAAVRRTPFATRSENSESDGRMPFVGQTSSVSMSSKARRRLCVNSRVPRGNTEPEQQLGLS